MENAYDIINKSFNMTRRDTSFSPSLLDELDDEKRKEVELKLIKLCLKGDRVSYQYISKLKFYNPSEVFTKENMANLSPYDQSLIYKILYDTNHNKEYLDLMVENSKNDVNTYSMLSLMYLNSDNKDDKLYGYLKEMSNNSEIHKAIFDVRCGNTPDVLKEDNEKHFAN